MSRLRVRGGRDAQGEPEPGSPYVYPAYATDAGSPTAVGIIDVSNYGAHSLVPNDPSAASNNVTNIRWIIDNNVRDDNPWSVKTIYFPAGTWWFNGLGSNTRGVIERGHQGDWRGRLRLQGATESSTILRLADSTFTDPANPRFVIYQSSDWYVTAFPHWSYEGTGNEAYHHSIRDLTVHLGSGNTGAVGLNVAMHNMGAIRRVTVDGRGGGFAGFAYERPYSGPGMLSDITVRGCQYGVRIDYPAHGFGIEHLTLSDQTSAGIRVNTNGLYVKHVTYTNTAAVPLAVMYGTSVTNHWDKDDPGQSTGPLAHTGGVTYGYEGSMPSLALIDVTASAPSTSIAAVQNYSTGKFYIRNMAASGFANAIHDQGAPVTGTTIGEYNTPPGPFNLWDEEPAQNPRSTPYSLNLTVPDTPTRSRPWPAVGDMVNAVTAGVPLSTPSGDVDCTAALQNLIDTTTATTIYFPSALGRFQITSTIYLRGKPRRFICNGANFYVPNNFGTNPVFQIDDSDTPGPFIWEDSILSSAPTAYYAYQWRINTSDDVVIQDSYALGIRNTSAATGKIFLDNVITGGVSLDYPQTLYARQFNAEAGTGFFKWVGGDLWVFYWKNEKGWTMCSSVTAGRVELIGIHATPQSTPPPGGDPNNGYWIQFSNANVSIEGSCEMRQLWSSGNHWTIFAKETQAGVTRNLVRTGNIYHPEPDPCGDNDPAYDSDGRHITLFRSKNV